MLDEQFVLKRHNSKSDPFFKIKVYDKNNETQATFKSYLISFLPVLQYRNLPLFNDLVNSDIVKFYEKLL